MKKQLPFQIPTPSQDTTRQILQVLEYCGDNTIEMQSVLVVCEEEVFFLSLSLFPDLLKFFFRIMNERAWRRHKAGPRWSWIDRVMIGA